jgi:hypothetical protein
MDTTMTTIPQDEQKLMELLQDVRNEAVEARNRLFERYRDRFDRDDPRIVVARHLKAAYSASFLSMAHLVENLLEPAWWTSNPGTAHMLDQPDLLQDEIHDYGSYIAVGFIFNPFSLFEAGVRRVVRALDGEACSGGAAEFKAIYEWLFKRLRADGWSADDEECNFLDVYRGMRNTLHNNGKFYSRTGRDMTVTWRGQRYEFVHAESLGFGGWDFYSELARTLIALNESIMGASLVARLPPIQ